jgi:protein tyrosine/serine phosphatase
VIDSTSSRAVTWDGCVNVRDLGGLPTEDGGTTQPGRIIRSDNVGVLTPGGWRSVEEHGVVRIVDLRWPEEIADDPPRDSDIEVVNVSVLGGSIHADPEWVRELNAHVDTVDDITDHYAWSYVEFLERNRAAFGSALAAVADADGPVVVHCMGGKDRTGLVSALLLRLAGVSLDVIGEDYSLSGPILMATRGEWLDDAPTEGERKRREKLSRTPAEAMRRVIATIESRYGSVEAYLAAAGVTPAQLEALHTRLR